MSADVGDEAKTSDPDSFPELLRRAREGDGRASWRMFELLQSDLWRHASRLMRHQPHGHTFQSMDLVNEVCVRAQRAGPRAWNDRTHALLCLTEAMRNVLRDHARRKKALRRSSGGARVPLDDIVDSFASSPVEFEAYHDLLDRLSVRDPRMSLIVDLKVGRGYTMQEITDILDVSKRTVERDWEAALACLRPAMR